METGRRERLIETLGSGPTDAQAAALSDLRMLDLGDERVLLAALRLCDSSAPLPPGLGSGASADPFADFFCGRSAEQTLGEHAAERILAAGLPGMSSVAEALARSLDEPGPSPRRIETIARLLAESPWEDQTETVRHTLPGLLRADASLFAVVTVADEATLDLLLGAALNPFRARLVHELLNCEPSRPAALEALAAAATRGLPDPEAALQVVALLYQWAYEGAGEAAEALEPLHPWAVAFTAIGQPEARPRLKAWLEEDPGPLPDELTRWLCQVLEQQEPLERYPLPALLERIDGGCGPLIAWDAVREGAPLLRHWARLGLREEVRLERAWKAVHLLAGIHGLQEVALDVLTAIEQDEVPLDPALLTALGQHRPAIPGLPDALMGLAERHPEALSAICAGLQATGVELADFADRALTWAENAPVERIPRRRGLVETRRAGVDLRGLDALITALGDPELGRRLDEVRPVIGPAP